MQACAGAPMQRPGVGVGYPPLTLLLDYSLTQSLGILLWSPPCHHVRLGIQRPALVLAHPGFYRLCHLPNLVLYKTDMMTMFPVFY